MKRNLYYYGALFYLFVFVFKTVVSPEDVYVLLCSLIGMFGCFTLNILFDIKQEIKELKKEVENNDSDR